MVDFLNTTNLNSVTVATEGDAVDTVALRDKVIFYEVTNNTGAVTLVYQGSYDGTKWFDIVEAFYTASNTEGFDRFEEQLPFMRTITKDHTNATVKTTITGLNELQFYVQ